ncbi:hypothetical protein [Curtobacterium sp. UCD-KPL2560]|uniref:hypothetical protein n=1 Tax=Curtobacterium sp. UCD-KPL2560 TaxID=1885315 RepID=UPI0008241402|nr:hypothetical protein [Curtobacterium sp. UCD-KPL2560]
MTIPASPVSQLLTAVAELLDEAGVGVWSPGAGTYGPDDVPIFRGTERPVDNPQIILNWVDTDQHPEITQGDGILQVAMKGLPNQPASVDDLGYAVFGVLHGLTQQAAGDALIVQCLRRNSVPMGQDEKLRKERADQYDVVVEWPPTSHRL